MKGRLVSFPQLYGIMHFVIDFQNLALCPVFALGMEVPFFHDWKCFHDVLYIIATDAIENEESSIQLTAEKESSSFIPAKGGQWTFPCVCKVFQIPGGIGKLKASLVEPVAS